MDDNQNTLALLQALNRQVFGGQNSLENMPQAPRQEVAYGSQDTRFVELNAKLDRIIKLLERRNGKE